MAAGVVVGELDTAAAGNVVVPSITLVKKDLMNYEKLKNNTYWVFPL